MPTLSLHAGFLFARLWAGLDFLVRERFNGRASFRGQGDQLEVDLVEVVNFESGQPVAESAAFQRLQLYEPRMREWVAGPNCWMSTHFRRGYLSRVEFGGKP